MLTRRSVPSGWFFYSFFNQSYTDLDSSPYLIRQKYGRHWLDKINNITNAINK